MGDHEHCGHGCSCSREHAHHDHGCSGDDKTHACSHHHGHHHGYHHDYSCGCGHDHGDAEAAKAVVPRLLLALALFALGMILPVPAWLKTVLLLFCYAVSGYDVLRDAWRSLAKGHMLDENYLMAAASLAAW